MCMGVNVFAGCMLHNLKELVVIVGMCVAWFSYGLAHAVWVMFRLVHACNNEVQQIMYEMLASALLLLQHARIDYMHTVKSGDRGKLRCRTLSLNFRRLGLPRRGYASPQLFT